MVTGFEQAWRETVGDEEKVSPELKDLVRRVFEQVTAQPTRVADLNSALESLLSFLSSRVGRTEANCVATDQFFCLHDEYPWDHLPTGYREVVANIGGALHDVFRNPAVAESCDSTPERLLQRVRDL